MDPDVHDARIILGLSHCVGYAAAALGVLDPELTDGRIRIRETKVTALGMAERGGVEIKLEIVLLSPLDPALELLYAHLVAVDELSSKVTIDLMEVYTVITGKQGLHKLKVSADLIDVAGTTRIVACGLDTA